MTQTAEGGGFKFTIPEHLQGYSDIANTVIQLGAISTRLARENRTLVDRTDGRAENVSEHANMLARIASIIAALFFPDLNTGLVSLYATIHDDLEAYVGDTPTHIISAQGLIDKEKLEQLALTQLQAEFSHIPPYVELMRSYQEQAEPEARFVRVLDKVMPFTLHLNENGQSIAENWTKEDLLARSEAKSAEIIAEYPEFSALVEVRKELVALCVERYL